MVEEGERVVEPGAQGAQFAALDAVVLGAHLDEADVVGVGGQHGKLTTETNLNYLMMGEGNHALWAKSRWRCCGGGVFNNVFQGN